MKQRTFFTLMMQLAFGSILFLGCSKSKDLLSEDANGSVRTAGSVPSTTSYAARISIEHGGFNPADVTVMQGGSILWINSDGEQVHTVTADDGSFDSGDIQPGGSFSFTFNSIGPHPYHCKYHKEMTGIVKCVTK